MTNYHLWKQLECFEFDPGGVEFSFSQRLARENNWSANDTKRVILEYKKFIYLCCISDRHITPSDSVDQVWHLHLTYTHSYWDELCQKTLGRNLHHNPTKGGKREKEKFSSYYDATFEKYLEEFGENPPKDIWQENRIRFGKGNFKRINADAYWLIRKPSESIRRNLGILLFIIPLASLLIQASDTKGIVSVLAVVVVICLISLIFKGGGDGNGCSSGCASGCSSGDSGCSGCGGCGGD